MGEVEIQALRDATFTVEQGELCVIVGPSGAGKTTLLKHSRGMDTLTEGKILLGGEEISAYPPKSSPPTAATTSALSFSFTTWSLT